MIKKIILSPIERFLKLEASSGILLIIAAALAIFMANTGLHHFYHDLLHFPVNLQVGSLDLNGTLHHWVNDALMVIFFFVVGLEIKRELVMGELSSPKKAALPLFAALGGMVVPAAIYALLNMSGAEGTALNGWGIPMATDIAFAVGVITLLGNRVPFSLKIFLLALAIVDDLGAVFVIAAFYTSEIHAGALGVAGIGCVAMILFHFIGIRSVFAYVLLGVAVWLGFFKSGVHATIAGVVIGFLTPVQAMIRGDEFGKRIAELSETALKKLRFQEEAATKIDLEYKDRKTILELRRTAYEGLSPMDRLIDQLHPWVSFFIMPVFAFFNAGVEISTEALSSFLSSPVSMGVVLGLVVGKPVGILLFSWLSTVLKMASLPTGVNWKQVLGLGFLGGIGFTMSLFVTGLAISEPFMADLAKMGILSASLLASIAGALILIVANPNKSTK
jgi:NhaA family Na+:H+ antiporter